jgi:hypothetical protein
MGVLIMCKTCAKPHENPLKTPCFDPEMYPPESRENSRIILYGVRLRVLGVGVLPPFSRFLKVSNAAKLHFCNSLCVNQPAKHGFELRLWPPRNSFRTMAE